MEPLPEPFGADFDARWIVFRDADLIIVDKPAGMACQAADPEHPDDLVTRLRRFMAVERGVAPEAVYLGVHQRLDRDTSGLVLYTLRHEANAGVASQFEARAVTKRYHALVAPYDGPQEVTLRDRLAPGPDGRMQVVAAASKASGKPGKKRGKRRATVGDRQGKSAVTHVTCVGRSGELALLALGLETGRTHQLRVQLAHAGWPIVGDRLYGDTAAPRLWLHAAELRMRHPTTGAPLELRSERPDPCMQALSRGPKPTDLAADGTADLASELAASPDGRPLYLWGFDVALARALQDRWYLARARGAAAQTTAYRLLHGVADGVPGLAVDVYDRFLVLHIMGSEAQAHEEALLDRLDALGMQGVYLKRHPRQKNELGADAQGELCPAEPARGLAAPETLIVYEHGVPIGVRLGDGLRTGIFLDQRDNRQRVAKLAAGKRLLNLFAYTGGFSVAALHAGAADALCVDSSKAVLARGHDNVARIDATERYGTVGQDAFSALERFGRQARRFDVIVLDPPSYSTGRKRRFRVVRDYPELAALCLRVLAPGGTLLACINHHQVSQVQLRSMVRRGAELAGVELSHVRDAPGQRDFPAEPGKQPLAKQVFALR